MWNRPRTLARSRQSSWPDRWRSRVVPERFGDTCRGCSPTPTRPRGAAVASNLRVLRATVVDCKTTAPHRIKSTAVGCLTEHTAKVSCRNCTGRPDKPNPTIAAISPPLLAGERGARSHSIRLALGSWRWRGHGSRRGNRSAGEGGHGRRLCSSRGLTTQVWEREDPNGARSGPESHRETCDGRDQNTFHGRHLSRLASAQTARRAPAATVTLILGGRHSFNTCLRIVTVFKSQVRVRQLLVGATLPDASRFGHNRDPPLRQRDVNLSLAHRRLYTS